MPKNQQKIKSSNLHRSLIHHSHSGRLVHRRHTSYPLMGILMLVAGLLMAGATFTVKADIINITATVLGQPPANAAVITQPTNGQTFDATPIDVRGTCPSNSIVKIYRNDVFSGSDTCSAQGTFYIVSDLFVGKNTLVARVFNYAFVEGPASEPVEVTFQPKSSAPGSPSPGQPSAPAQLYLQSDVQYQGLYPKQEITWPVEIGGGTAPYAVFVDWGDGTNDVISRSTAGKFEVKHVYQKPGGYNGTYKISIKASDSQGNTTYLQLVVVVNDPSLITSSDNSDGIGWLETLQDIYDRIIMLWPFYIVTVLMLLSFWLGERYKFDRLYNSGRLRRR